MREYRDAPSDRVPGILVTAATGPLRPAVVELTRRGAEVVALARNVAGLEQLRDETGAVPLQADWDDPDELRRKLESTAPFDAALLYCPTVPQESLDALRSVVTGRMVRLLPSHSAGQAPSAPFVLADLGPSPQREVRVVLGWSEGSPARWHTSEELSGAALAALDTGQERMLGVVRPWSFRPV